MDTRKLDRLVKQAREDPQFFHALVFKTEETVAKLDYLDRFDKSALLATDPQRVIGELIGWKAGCDVTCTSSCGATCGSSCGYTTNMLFDPASFVSMYTPRPDVMRFQRP